MFLTLGKHVCAHGFCSFSVSRDGKWTIIGLCYSAVLSFSLLLVPTLSLAGKKTEGKHFPTLKTASDIPTKSNPRKILENKMGSCTHFMILGVITLVVQLFGNFHVEELEISAVIS